MIAASVIAVIALFLVLRPGASDDTSGPGTTTFRVTVRDGTVHAPARPTVKQGDRVRIVVDADVADEVHLHGYDLHAEVAPEEPAQITFTADAAGVFECELEDADELLFRLEVSP